MTLEDVSGVTKISVRNLRALEQEKFDQMPGGIFNRGFVRSYAKHLGLDDDQVVLDYQEAAREIAPPAAAPMPETAAISPKPAAISSKSAPEPPRQTENTAPFPWVALVGVVVLGTLVLAFWTYHSKKKTAETTPQEQFGQLAVSTEPSPPSSASNAPAATSDNPPAPATSLHPSPSPNGGFDVALRAHDEVWLSTAVDGQPPSESTMENGQSITVHATDRAILRVGNAGALDVVFNGQKIPVRAADGEVRTLTFTTSGLQTPTPAASHPN